jgi:hypothetical protein
MAQVTVSKQVALDVLDGDKSQGEVILDEIIDHRRWSVVHRVIFKVGNRFLEGRYSRGATENQDEQPWEYGGDPKFTEVEPYQATVTLYRPTA